MSPGVFTTDIESTVAHMYMPVLSMQKIVLLQYQYSQDKRNATSYGFHGVLLQH